MAAPLDDGIYSQRRALALKQYQDALLGLDTNWQQQQLLSGVNAVLDDKGQFSRYEANPLSQYGGFQKMLWNQGGNLDVLRNTSYDRGLRGRGLGAQGQSDYRYQMGDERLQFGRSLVDSFNNWSGGKQRAKSAYDSSLLDIEQQRIQDAMQQGAYDEQPDPGQGNVPNQGGQSRQIQPWAQQLYAKSDALNAKYGKGVYAKPTTPTAARRGSEGYGPSRGLAAQSEALNRQYGLGSYAKSSIYYKK